MSRKTFPSIKRFLTLLLCAVILLQNNLTLFANGLPQYGAISLSQTLSEEDLSSIDKIDLAYQKSAKNPYENAVIIERDNEIKKLKNNKNLLALNKLKADNSAKYGDMLPKYLHISAGKYIKPLEQDLRSFVGYFFAKRSVMPFDKYQTQYNKTIQTVAADLLKTNGVQGYSIFRNPQKELAEDLLKAMPAKQAYDEYTKEAKAEIAWRKANTVKVEQAGYEVIRVYVEKIGAENFSPEVLSLLLNWELAGKKVITEQEKTKIFNYNIARLEQENLSLLKIGITANGSKKKIAAHLASDLIERIIIAGYLSSKNPARYDKAVKNLIYKSKDTQGFSSLLGTGFSALLAAGDFAALDEILKKYSNEEQNSGSWTDWLNLTHYSGMIQNRNGKYLGAVSELTQYSTDYIYSNVFTDLAELLAADARPQSLSLLKKYSTISTPILPFLSGALLSGGKGLSKAEAENLALNLANLDLGDIQAIYEYDIDHGLLMQYPAIKKDLKEYAITTKEKRSQKESRVKGYGYLNRAAFSGDIALMIWGTVTLFKLGGKAVSISKSTYTAIKAGRITNKVQRFAYIRANYAKLGKYVDARNSIFRLKNRLKLATGGKVNITEIRKLQNNLNTKNLAILDAKRQQTAQVVSQAAKPTARQTAKAELAEAQYNTLKAQMDFNLKSNLYGNSYNLKTASYLDKVKAYRANSGATPFPSKPAYTIGELDFVASAEALKTSQSNLNLARNNYRNTSFLNKYIINPVKNWWNKDSYATFGISELETGKGITIAEAFNLKGTYNPDYTTGPRFFTGANKPSAMNKFYSWLDNHNMPTLSKGLRFVNNKATLNAGILLFNYNVATITPTVANTANFGAATELVANAPKATFLTSPTLAGGWLNTAKANMPLNLVDPKLFQAYKTIPLPGGNIINTPNLNGLTSTWNKLSTTVTSAVIVPALLTKDLFTGFSQKQLQNVHESFRPASTANHTHIYNPSYLKAYAHVLPFIFNPLTTPIKLAAAPTKENTAIVYTVEEKTNLSSNLVSYKNSAEAIYAERITTQENMIMKPHGMSFIGTISYIEKEGLDSSGLITLELYNDYKARLLQIAPRLSLNTFDHLLKTIMSKSIIEKIATENISEKTRNAKIEQYLGSLDYFDVYYQALVFPTNIFVNIQQFPSAKDFSKDNLLKSIDYLNEKEFAKTTISNLFSSQNLKHILRRSIDASTPEEAIALSQSILTNRIKADAIKASGDRDIAEVKGCLVAQGSAWDETDGITPERVGISVEYSQDNAASLIVDWMHKNNIPLEYEGAPQLDEILANLRPWAKNMLGLNTIAEAKYIENSEGEAHIYNKDYTARIRLGRHELLGGKPHIHFEFLENENWKGILNYSYYFKGYEHRQDEIIASLEDLKNYFRPDSKASFAAYIPEPTSNPQKFLYILGGPNASGKTNLYKKLLEQLNLPFLNQDILAEQKNISPIQAAREIVTMIDDMFDREKSFIYESTLSGRNLIHVINKAHDLGYKVMIVYTFVKDPETSIARAKKRVEEGGHDVPFGDLTQRYYKSRSNFWNIYKEMADDWVMFLNGDEYIIPIAMKKQTHTMQVLDENLYHDVMLTIDEFESAVNVPTPAPKN